MARLAAVRSSGAMFLKVHAITADSYIRSVVFREGDLLVCVVAHKPEGIDLDEDFFRSQRDDALRQDGRVG